MPEVTTFTELEALEAAILARLGRFPVDEVLLALREYSERLEPFVAAGMASLALRASGPPTGRVATIPWRHVEPIADAVAHYLLSDPITFDKHLETEFYGSNPGLLLLRIMGSQFPYHVSGFEAFARSLYLFEEIPATLQTSTGFDFDAKFRATTSGIGVSDMVKIGVVGWALSHRPRGLTSQVLEKFRSQGGRLGTYSEVRQGFRLLSANVAEFRALHARFREKDPRFRMYEFNPLHVYPLIRPWGNEPFWSDRGGRMIAPLPELVAARVSLGIYHQMLTRYGTEFSQYFGDVFSEYCGRLLGGTGAGILFSENDVRRTYPASGGRKAPDWVIVDGTTCILVECKATRFTRAAIATGADQAVNDSLRQVMKGLRQLHQFREACRQGAAGLEAFHHCRTFIPVVLTLELLHAVNSTFFREGIDAELAASGIVDLPWQIVAMEELEYLERHVRGGIPWEEALATRPTREVVTEYAARTGMSSNESSFLYPKWRELMERLGVPDEGEELLL